MAFHFQESRVRGAKDHGKKVRCWLEFRGSSMDDYAKDGGSGEVWLLCSFYHEPLALGTWIKTNVNKFAPGDFVTNVKQINSQSDLTSISSFAGPSYFTVRSSLYTILIWDPCIFNLYNVYHTGSSLYLRRKPHQCALRFNEQITRTHFLLEVKDFC